MARDFSQSSSQYLASLDAEIERLQNLREQVAAAVGADEAIAKPAQSARRGISVEGRRRIAEAQMARWAKQKRKDGKSVAKAPAKTSAKRVKKKTPAKKKTAVKISE